MMVDRSAAWGLVLVVGCALTGGCEDDDQAVAALEELASEQRAIVDAQNQKIDEAVAALEACISEIATLEDDTMILNTKDHDFEAPVLAGEPTVQALEALRTAIAETIELQKIELAKIEAAAKKCEGQRAEAAEAAREARKVEKAAEAGSAPPTTSR